jgi:hypothetical protein
MPRASVNGLLRSLAFVLAVSTPQGVGAATRPSPDSNFGYRQARAIYRAIESSLDTLDGEALRWRTIYFIRHDAMPLGEFPTVNEAMVYHAAKELLAETGLTPRLIREVLAALH